MIEQITFGISIGVTSGLATAIVLWCLTNVWINNITPWYEKRVYKGTQIQGTWHLQDTDSDDDPWQQSETMDLAQIAHRLSGTATIIPKSGENVSPTSLVVTGDVVDRFVTLTCRSPSRNRLSYSVLLLEITGDGNELRGETAYYDIQKQQIKSSEVVYFRRQ